MSFELILHPIASDQIASESKFGPYLRLIAIVVKGMFVGLRGFVLDWDSI